MADQYYFWLGRTYGFLGRRELATQNLKHALEEVMLCRDTGTIGKIHFGLQMEMMFADSFQHSIVHGQQVISYLEETEEHFWLGMSLDCQGLVYNLSGDFHHAQKSATRVRALGEMIGDYRLQTRALMNLGRGYTMQGEWKAGIVALQQALSLSPDAYEKAFALEHLGHAYLEQGDVTEALPLLEQAVLEARQYRSCKVQCGFQIFLSQAHLITSNIEKSRDLAQQVLTLSTDIQYPWGIGVAQRILGRFAHSVDNLTEAEHCFQESLTIFADIRARYELARTHLDLASLAHTQGNRDTATTHLSTAYVWFKKLQIPKWIEKTEQLAREYGATLTEMEPEAFETEGSS